MSGGVTKSAGLTQPKSQTEAAGGGSRAAPLPQMKRVTQPEKLRDWFAGMALSGELASQSSEHCITGNKKTMQECANKMYEMADAMLEARKDG